MRASNQDWSSALDAGSRMGVVPWEALQRAKARLAQASRESIPSEDVADWTGIDARALEELLGRSGATPTVAARVDPATGKTALLEGPPALLRPVVPKRLGPYELLDELGHGGMGIVFRARHVLLDSRCAVKVLIAGEHASPEAIARFQREAAAVARMGRHPNLIGVHDMGQEGSVGYYAMDLVEGKSLRERLNEGLPAPSEAARIVEKAALGVQFAHEHGVIHRDLKPENIVLRADPGGGPAEPLVMDFGLAREVGSSAQISVSGQILGTPSYMAPEQARGDVGGVDARTDVYALGAVLYELLTGGPPHPGETAIQRIASVLTGEVVPPRGTGKDVPRDIETICMKCLEAEPARRYASARDLAEDLARYQRGEPVRARPAGAFVRLARRVARRKGLAAGVLLALLAATFGIAALVRSRNAAALEEWARPRVETALEDLERWDQHAYQQGVVLPSVRGEVEEVVRRLDEVLARHPSCVEAWYARGKACRRLRRLPEAERDLSKAIELSPGNAQYHLERARVTFELATEITLSKEMQTYLAAQLGGGWDARLAQVRRDLEIARDAGRLRPWEAEGCKAMLALIQEDWPGAIAILDRAIPAAPNEPDLYYLRGLAALSATSKEETRKQNLPYFRHCLEDARKALTIKQSFFDAALLVGWALFALSQEEPMAEAERHDLLRQGLEGMAQANRIDPDRQIGFYLLGHVWFWSTRNRHTPFTEEEGFTHSAEAFEQSARLAPWNDYAVVWGSHARARLALSRPDAEAIPMLRDLVQRLAGMHWYQDWAYRSFLEGWANWQLAVRLARTGESAADSFARAQDLVQKGLKENVNPGLCGELVDALVRLAVERARVVPAASPACLADATACAAAAPMESLSSATSAAAAEMCGEWLASGAGEEAARPCLAHASRAVEADAKDARSLAWRGLAKLRLQDRKGAKEDLSKAIDRDASLAPRFARWLEEARAGE